MHMSMNHETAYTVTIERPMYRREYIVIAANFDRAAQMALAAEHKDGKNNASVKSVEQFGGPGCVLGETR